MPSFTWYGHPVYRYRNDENGRFVGERTLWRYSRDSIENSITPIADWATLSPQNWYDNMRQAIQDETIRQYALALGGKQQFSADDLRILDSIIADQVHYLDGMLADIEAELLSPAQIAARSKMYLRSTNEAFERAAARTRGLPEMPMYPGEGLTPCLTNCGCHWSYHFRPSKGTWECFWTMNPALENCRGCIENATQWSPLIIETGTP